MDLSSDKDYYRKRRDFYRKAFRTLSEEEKRETVADFLDNKYGISLSNNVLFLHEMFDNDSSLEEKIIKRHGKTPLSHEFKNAYAGLERAVRNLEEAVDDYKRELDEMGTTISEEGGNPPFDYTPVNY